MKQTRVAAHLAATKSPFGSPALRRAGDAGRPLPVSFDLSRIAIHSTDVIRGAAPSVVRHAIDRPGEPLPARLRARFAAGLGPEVSRVRVHRGALAAEATGAVPRRIPSEATWCSIGRRPMRRSRTRSRTRRNKDSPSHQLAPARSLRPMGRRNARRSAPAGPLLAGGRPGALGSSPVQVARKPKKLHVTIVGVGVPTADQQKIAKAARAALSSTTRGSSDTRIKAGVDVEVADLAGADAARRRGDTLVYVIGGARTGDKRDAAVRQILDAHGWADDKHNRSTKKDKLTDDVSRISSQLQEDRGLFDHTTGASLVDISDLPKALSAANIRSIAGTALHEGVGHPAGLDHHGTTGVMSSDAPNTARAADIIFDAGDETKVNRSGHQES